MTTPSALRTSRRSGHTSPAGTSKLSYGYLSKASLAERSCPGASIPSIFSSARLSSYRMKSTLAHSLYSSLSLIPCTIRYQLHISLFFPFHRHSSFSFHPAFLPPRRFSTSRNLLFVMGPRIQQRESSLFATCWAVDSISTQTARLFRLRRARPELCSIAGACFASVISAYLWSLPAYLPLARHKTRASIE
ncbi:hypothetical protein C8R47DRAFT_9209 [Mycena vitilis]|nr:hypothetical protein C8R47DRAFT_9209 [Mycena vitilis]